MVRKGRLPRLCPVSISAFLPPKVLIGVRDALLGHDIRPISIDELLFSTYEVTPDAILVDPGAIDPNRFSALRDQILRNRSTSFVALGELSPATIHRVVDLANIGLCAAFVYPLSSLQARRLLETCAALPARKLGLQFLGAFERRVGTLTPGVRCAILDLFEQPRRYERAGDLAIEAGIIARQLYRTFGSSDLGSPRKLVVVARMLHAYACFRREPLTVAEVGARVGYQSNKTFVQHSLEIFGCCPSMLRYEADAGKVLEHLIEWYYKPRPIRSRTATLQVAVYLSRRQPTDATSIQLEVNRPTPSAQPNLDSIRM
jgi:AraC-like DNA-binding protein